MVKILVLIGIFLLCQLANLLSAIRMVWCIFANQDRAWLIAKSYDRVGNAAANDDDVQTISQRAQKAKVSGKRWGCWLCKLLDRVQPNHCEDSVK